MPFPQARIDPDESKEVPSQAASTGVTCFTTRSRSLAGKEPSEKGQVGKFLPNSVNTSTPTQSHEPQPGMAGPTAIIGRSHLSDEP
jgi:hypothetical protein